MSARADILAGRAVILVNIQDAIDKQLRGIRGKMRVFANSMSEIGGDLFRGGIAGSVASFFPVKSFVDFQDSILFMQAKLKDTGVDVQDLTEYIRELGKTTSFTSKEIAEGAAVLAQAGLGMKVKGTLLPMLDLARSARVDVDTAGRIMANTMMAFEVPADMAGEVASKLTTAARLGTTDLVLMAESLKFMQTTARGLNIPLDETLALITHLSNIGMRGSIAGTSLNAALGNLAAKPDQLKRMLGLVIEPEDVEQPLRLFAKLLDATKEMDALTKKATMSSLFNIRGERAFGGIMLQSLESLDKIINEIKRSTDEAREAAVLMDSRLGGVWRRGLSAAQEFGLAVGSTAEGPLSKFGVAAQKVFQNLSNLAQANPQLVQTILLIPPAALAAGAGLLLMSTMLSKVIMLIGPLITLNAALFKSLAAIVGVNLKAISSVFDSMTRGAVWLGANQGPNIPFVRGLEAMGSGIATVKRTMQSFIPVAERTQKSVQRVASGIGILPAVGGDAKKFLDNLRPFTAKGMALPILTPQLQLNPRSIQLPIIGRQVEALFKNVTQGKQLTLPLQFALDFGGGEKLRPNDFLKPGAANYKFNTEAEKIISSITQKIIGGKTARRELARSGEFSKELNKRLSSVLRKVQVPNELIPRIIKDVTSQVERTNIKASPKLMQKMFDFQDAPATSKIVQQMFAFDDVPKQMDKAFSIGRSKIIGRNATFATEFVGKLGTPNMMAARQAAGDLQNAAILASRKAPRRNLFGWVKPLVNDVKLLFPSMKSVTGIFAHFGTVVRSIGRWLISVDWVSKMMVGFRGIWSVAKGVLTVLNGIRRVLFSLSGWLLIAEVLIIFGDKIPIVKDALAGLGRAFSNVFGNISDTLKDMGPGFNAIIGGISKMFTGGGIELGFADIGAGFRSMGKALSEGVVHTWRQFVADIEPGAIMIRNAVKGIIGVFDALVATIGSVFGTVVQGGGILIKADGSLLELFKSIFSPENFQAFFTVIITLIGEIGKGINTALGHIFTALDAIKRTFVSIIQGLNKTFGFKGTFDEALSDMDENANLRASLQAAIANTQREYISERNNPLASIRTINRLEGILSQLHTEIDALGYTNPFTDMHQQRNANLEEKIQEALQGVLSMSNPMGIAPDESNQKRLRRLAKEEFGAFGPENLEEYILNPLDSFGTVVDETTNALLETRKRLLTDLGGVAAMDAIREELGAAPNIQAAKGAIGQIAPAVKALIGDFESTRGNKVQFKVEQLQEKTNEILEDIRDNQQASIPRPAVFHA